MLGLQRLFEGLYGPTPQIDLDLQIARARVPQQHVFDFHAIADGLRRNNVGCDAITVGVRGSLADGTLRIDGTGQELPAKATAEAKGPWLWFDVEGFEEGETTQLHLIGSSDAITQRPAGPLLLDLDPPGQ